MTRMTRIGRIFTDLLNLFFRIATLRCTALATTVREEGNVEIAKDMRGGLTARNPPSRLCGEEQRSNLFMKLLSKDCHASLAALAMTVCEESNVKKIRVHLPNPRSITT